MIKLLAPIFGSGVGIAKGQQTLFEALGAPMNSSGIQVSEQQALGLTAVYRAISIISEGVAQLPVDVFQKVDESRVHINSPIEDTLNVRANDHMSAFTFRSTMLSHVLGYGNGYAEIQLNGGGEPVALWPLMPDCTLPIIYNGELSYNTTIDGQNITLPAERVLHVPGLSYDGYIGYSPIRLHRESLGLAKAMEEHAGKYFRHETTSGGIIEVPGALSDTQLKNMRESWYAQGGLSNAHRAKILEGGAKFNRHPINHSDAQFLENRQYQVEEVSRMYGVPLFMLSSETKSTSWGTGIGQMSLGFLRYTLQPWIVRLEQEYRYKLLSAGQRRNGFYIKHNVSSLLRGDSQARAAYYTSALNPQSGWMQRDEVRALEELNPLGEDTKNESGIIE